MAEKEKKPKSKVRKIIEWVLFGLFGAACILALVANISAMIHKKENYGQSIRFGVGNYIILTDSMEPEIKKKDFITTYKQDVTTFEQRLKNGEKIDVTFMNVSVNVSGFVPDTEVFKKAGGPTSPTGLPMTHRLREVHYIEKEDGSGTYVFVASGINTQGFESREGQYQIFTEKEYIGTVKHVSHFIGLFMSFISSAWGLIILLLVPAGYLIVIYSIDILKAVKDVEEKEEIESKNNTGDHLSGISAKDRERLKNELMEEMLKQKKEGKK